jgi:hypothetical protein
MSILPYQTNIDLTDSWFINNTNNINLLSSINVYNGSINTSQINLDSIQMDCAVLNSVPTLLLNGVPVASTSSFTSSISLWSAYPALSPITYATSGGTGGAINMANVNSLTNVSSATGTFGSVSSIAGLTAVGPVVLGGYQFPMNATGNSISALASTTLNVSNGQIITTDFTGQPNGLYYLQAILQTASADPATCGFVLVKTGTGVTGGGTHVPSFLPSYGSAPSLANCVVCQSSAVTSSTIDILVFGSANTPNGLLSSTVQIAVWRLT